jgi:hypothetical protein
MPFVDELGELGRRALAAGGAIEATRRHRRPGKLWAWTGSGLAAWLILAGMLGLLARACAII